MSDHPVWTQWLTDRRDAAVSVGALLRAVPLLGGLLVLVSTLAGLLALGVMGALAILGTADGNRIRVVAAVALAVVILAEVAAHALARLLATMSDRRLAGSLRERVMTAILRPTATDRLTEPALSARIETVRGIGIRREPKPGAALPAITAWWITTSRRGGAFMVLLTGHWWVAPVAALAWLAMPTRWDRRASTAVRVVLAAGALAAALSNVAVDVSIAPVWRITLLLAVLALPADAGTTLTRVRQLLRNGNELVAAARELPARLTGPELTLPGTARAPVPRREIRLEGVEIREGHRIDLTVAAGRITVLTGTAGEVAPLLVRLRDPRAGRVIVDGVDLRDVDAAAWWRRIAYVPANPLPLPSDLADNMFLDGGSPDGRAWTVAGLDDLVRQRVVSGRTPLTADLRGGVDLDEAEWQRIALARALVRIRHGARLLVVANAGDDALRVVRFACDAYPGLTAVLADLTCSGGLRVRVLEQHSGAAAELGR